MIVETFAPEFVSDNAHDRSEGGETGADDSDIGFLSSH